MIKIIIIFYECSQIIDITFNLRAQLRIEI